MPSPSRPIERARPLLGTIVAIRVGGLPGRAAHAAIGAAFAAVAHVHARMSFQDPASDVSRLNRAGDGERTRVDPHTAAVLTLARTVAQASGGVFDPTVAGDLVAQGRRPVPAGAPPPDPAARWDDIVVEGTEVRLRRPLILDLSGIAKGYAVDRAAEILASAGAAEVCIDAGGDMRLVGPPQRIALRTGFADDLLPVVDLADGSLASSGGCPDPRQAAQGEHRHGGTRRPAEAGRFACVLAPTCAVADALTKVVLVMGAESGPVLAAFAAAAHLREAAGGWCAIPDPALSSGAPS